MKTQRKKKKKKLSPQKIKKRLKKECDILWSRLTKEIHRSKHGDNCLWCRGKIHTIKMMPEHYDDNEDLEDAYTEPVKTGGKNLQSDHIINRWRHSTRWRVENCVVLCMACHLFRKKRDPLGWAEMVRENIGDDMLAKLKEMGEELFDVNIPNLEQVKAYLTKLDNEKPWMKGYEKP